MNLDKIKRFLKKKKWVYLVLFIVLIGIVLFIYFLVFALEIEISKPKKEIPEEFKGDKTAPISSVYRYDWQIREYISDKGGSWQNLDFLRYIYDLDEESGLNSCHYFLYDNIKGQISRGGGRKCNSNLTVKIDPDDSSSSQGEKAYTLYVFATDLIGNGTMNSAEETAPSRFGTVTYNIDWEAPIVGKIYIENKKLSEPIYAEKDKSRTYLVKVSDNVGVDYCWLYVDGKNVKIMEIRPQPCKDEGDCIASAEHTFTAGEIHRVWARCADHYNYESGNYLNISSGPSVEINISVNHSPEISSCQVSPTSGTSLTNFQFKVEAADSDEDSLSYNWDFGDEEGSNEQNSDHQYLKPGTYQPKVTVFDGKDGRDNCSTAWVIISE